MFWAPLRALEFFFVHHKVQSGFRPTHITTYWARGGTEVEVLHVPKSRMHEFLPSRIYTPHDAGSNFTLCKVQVEIYITPTSFGGLCVAILLVCRKTVVVIFVHRGIGPSLLRRPQLSTSALKKGLQMAKDVVDIFLVDHFVERWLKFKREMEASYKDV
jgi:hypothetical protein